MGTPGFIELARQIQHLALTLPSGGTGFARLAGNRKCQNLDLHGLLLGQHRRTKPPSSSQAGQFYSDGNSKALQKDLPVDLRGLIECQLQGAQRNHDQVKALRDSYKKRA
ncbi:hypothetical protein OOT46_02670 [Aquabacterium sp. A7-Y]|uniref:hypothetical protein n=1 Tax=Aquabacterium sp. A7-Y TaxID=1349605 RepID=UPI00223D52A8|nr:hypothetical protein [Aquabacterium sp. A7-Y]MCW7536756.1 hypothetical protein [Aquabacterium sp. A7-Y]